MKIEVPLSPYEEATIGTTPTTNENIHTHGTSGRKQTPFRVKKVNTDDNSPSLRSFRLERAPLSDIGNGESTVVTESVGPKAMFDLITLTPLHGGKNESKDERVDSGNETPTVVTGSTKKSSSKKKPERATVDLLSFDQRNPAHDDVHHAKEVEYERVIRDLREQVGFLENELSHSREQQQAGAREFAEEALRKELAELKDFIVDMDAEKRKVEKMLAEEKEERIRLEKEVSKLQSTRESMDATAANKFALREAAMQSRITSLKAMVSMVSMEKERLVNYTTMERSVAENTVHHSHGIDRHS